jgi:type I restriction enzyme, R subunit
MSNIGQPERETQNRIIRLFRSKLKYDYLGNLIDKADNSNLRPDLLRRFWVKCGYTEAQQSKALSEFENATKDLSLNLYYRNEAVYSLLRYGKKVKTSITERKETVWLIDWDNPLNNDFYIAEEVTIKGEATKRPDIVLYINGIAIAVLELKKSSISVSEGIRQNLDNQSARFIQPFFSTIQLLMAGNDTEGLRYGTIETKEKYYLSWKEESHEKELLLDQNLLQIADKERLIELLRDYLTNDRGVKKICRPHQYFGIKAAQEKIKIRKGGIIWHTQGSGKSLTMVWLANWILENITDARVLIITDRDDLDDQIEKVFKGVNQDIYRTKSGKDLVDVLDKSQESLICSLVHKFGMKKRNANRPKYTNKRNDEDYAAFINELMESLPKNFKAKGDVFIFVDECHRTQSGMLNRAMKKILPNSIFIGFTGTPLLKADKNVLTSIENFGSYIHTYRFDEAIADNVVLDLLYEARNVDQSITSQDKIDKWFEAKTQGLTENARAELKKRWGTMQKVLSSKSRLSKIVADIIMDMAIKDRLKSGHGNAMLVAGSIYEACKYYEIFQQEGFKKCAIITSYEPSPQDIKGESTGEDNDTEKIEQYEIYRKMLGGKDPKTFEKEVKKQFIDEPAQMKLLIVVDKLLTGFDAPPCTYLYIDKNMQDHGLFQAICRVNRLDGDDKNFGYIVDYKDLFDSLKKSVEDYTSNALSGYDAEDIQGLMNNRLLKGRRILDDALETVRLICEPIEAPKDDTAYYHFFCGDTPEDAEMIKKRTSFYKAVAHALRSYAIVASDMEGANYTKTHAETIRKEVKYYEDLKAQIKLRSGDLIDLKAYEPDMRYLIDTYINAEDSVVIASFDEENMSLIDLIVRDGDKAVESLPNKIKQSPEAVAETIENNVRRLIINEHDKNPAYYDKISKLLSDLVEARKLKAIEYAAHLQKIIALTKIAYNPSASVSYPKTIDTSGKQALYDNLGSDETLALAVHKEIQSTKKHGWLGNNIKEKQLIFAIQKHIPDTEKAYTIFETIKNHSEYIYD